MVPIHKQLLSSMNNGMHFVECQSIGTDKSKQADDKNLGVQKVIKIGTDVSKPVLMMANVCVCVVVVGG